MTKLNMVLVFLTIVLLSACTTTETPQRQFVEFKLIERSQTSGISFQQFFDLRTAQEFEDFWTIHSQPTRTPLPKIDFEQDMVIAVFYGQRQTGGYDIYIHNIEELETELVVNVRAIEPKHDSQRVMMINQPNMIIRLPTTQKPLRFIAEK